MISIIRKLLSYAVVFHNSVILKPKEKMGDARCLPKNAKYNDNPLLLWRNRSEIPQNGRGSRGGCGAKIAKVAQRIGA